MTTAYPAGLDTYTHATGGQTLDVANHTQRHEDIEDAVEAIEAELGVDPAGTDATVVARLDAIEAGTNIAAASTTVEGKIEIATDAEALAVTATDKAVVPSNLAAVTPSVLLADAPAEVADTTDTLAAADHGHTNWYSNAAAVTVTIPTDASDDLPDGFWTVLFSSGAGGLTLSTTGVTLSGSPNTTIVQGEALLVQKTATANTWLVMGGTAA